MCSEPRDARPSGAGSGELSRTAIRPGISVSAILISLRPPDSREISVMANQRDVEAHGSVHGFLKS